jgi:hypothetical protein
MDPKYADKYDLSEAKLLIAKKRDELEPNAAARRESALALFDQLLAVADGNVFSVSVDRSSDYSLWITHRDTSVRVYVVSKTGQITASPGGGPPRPFPGLAFNPVTSLWEGTEDDKFHPRAPNERPLKRGAVAVVVEGVMQMAEPPKEPTGLTA